MACIDDTVGARMFSATAAVKLSVLGCDDMGTGWMKAEPPLADTVAVSAVLRPDVAGVEGMVSELDDVVVPEDVVPVSPPPGPLSTYITQVTL